VVSDGFEPVAASLRSGLVEHFREHGKPLVGARLKTLETSSALVEARGEPLVRVLRDRLGTDSLAGLRIADLGCGFGALSLYFAAQGASVTAIDQQEEPLEVGRMVAEEHDLPVSFVAGIMQRLELPDAAFDVAVQNNSLCYVIGTGERRQALREALRILRPGGWLVTRDPNRWHPIDGFTRLPLIHLLPPERSRQLAERLNRKRSPARIASPLEVRRDLRAVGFVDISQPDFADAPRPGFVKLVARYHSFTARRPAARPWR
jgi:SAM-dependent methyltransferase